MTPEKSGKKRSSRSCLKLQLKTAARSRVKSGTLAYLFADLLVLSEIGEARRASIRWLPMDPCPTQKGWDGYSEPPAP